MKILAVDDEPNILELLKTYLEASELHDVVTAASGQEALEIIEASDDDFQCLLIDIQMPQMNGVTLCEHIRALPDYARTPIIMLTAMSQRQYIDKAFLAGATDYVTKPFDFLELKGRLQSAKTLVCEINGGVDSLKGSKLLIQKLTSEFLVGPDEPISFEGIPGLVGYEAFENYILHLSRASLLFASAFAIKVSNFKVIHESNSSIEVMDLVKRVARVIAGKLSHAGNFISYRGNGVFLCINHKRISGSPSEREAEINGSLVGTEVGVQGSGAIRVIVGDEISLRSISRSGALFALRRAVTSVETKSMPTKDMSSISRILLRNQSRSHEQSSLERRAYQIVLEDLVREQRRSET